MKKIIKVTAIAVVFLLTLLPVKSEQIRPKTCPTGSTFCDTCNQCLQGQCPASEDCDQCPNGCPGTKCLPINKDGVVQISGQDTFACDGNFNPVKYTSNNKETSSIWMCNNSRSSLQPTPIIQNELCLPVKEGIIFIPTTVLFACKGNTKLAKGLSKGSWTCNSPTPKAAPAKKP